MPVTSPKKNANKEDFEGKEVGEGMRRRENGGRGGTGKAGGSCPLGGVGGAAAPGPGGAPPGRAGGPGGPGEGSRCRLCPSLAGTARPAYKSPDRGSLAAAGSAAPAVPRLPLPSRGGSAPRNRLHPEPGVGGDPHPSLVLNREAPASRIGCTQSGRDPHPAPVPNREGPASLTSPEPGGSSIPNRGGRAALSGP